MPPSKEPEVQGLTVRGSSKKKKKKVKSPKRKLLLPPPPRSSIKKKKTKVKEPSLTNDPTPKLKTKKKKKAKGKGKPFKAEYSADVNCLSCSKWISCDDDKRAFTHVCNKFKQIDFSIISALDVDPSNIMMLTDDVSSGKIVDYTDFDIITTLNDLLESDSPLPPDIRIDDRDLPEAKNVFEWITGPRFLGSELYAKNMEIAIRTEQDYCPDCSDVDWLDRKVEVNTLMSEFESNLVLLHNGKCPKCHSTKADFMLDGRLSPITELAACIGQRSGKSFTNQYINSYKMHKLLKLSSPPLAYGLSRDTLLSGTFVAMTFAQAKTTMYDTLQGLLTDSPWFKEYNTFLRHKENEYGEELFTVKDTYARYKHRNLIINPAGPDKRKLRGSTRVIGSIDEIGWMIAASTGGIKFDPDEIYKAMKNSFTSAVGAWRQQLRRGVYSVPAPLFSCISSPSSKKDKIMRLLDDAKHDESMLGFHASTWEINPVLDRNYFKSMEKRDPAGFWRDFGAVPPMSSSPYISQSKYLADMCGKEENASILTNRKVRTSSGKILLSGKLKHRWSDSATPRLLALDAGVVNNSFGMALGHIDGITDNVHFDLLTELIPNGDNPISFSHLEEDIIGEIIENYGVTAVVSDRWQNIKLLQDLERKYPNLETYTYSLKYEDFDKFKADIFEGDVTIPKPEMPMDKIEALGESSDYPHNFYKLPVSHFILQCLTVRDMKEKGVEKGEGLTDDVFRATVLAHSFLASEDFREDFIARAHRSNKPSGAIGVMVSAGGSSARGSSAGAGSSSVAVGMSGGNMTPGGVGGSSIGIRGKR